MCSLKRIATLLAILLCCCSQPSWGLRILAIFPLNVKSHHVMCERLTMGLAAKGHQLDVYHHFAQKKPLANLREYSLEGTMPARSNNMSYDRAIQLQTINVRAILDDVGTPTCGIMELPIFRELRENPLKYDLVIVEAFVSPCFLAWGRHLGIPMVGVSTTPLIDWYNDPLGNPFNTAVVPSLAVKFRHPMNFWQRLANTVLSKALCAQFDFMVREQNAYVERIFGPGYPSVTELAKDLDLLLVNSHHSLEGVRPYTPAVVPVAGLHIVDDNTTIPEEVQKWLDESKDGCIYFSFGSMITMETYPKPILDAFYATFKNIAPIRVLLKIDKPELLPPGLPSNVMTQKWFPQIQVLKHKNVKAFITHGGLMSSLESIHCGVPMIGVPLFGDQYQNVEINVERGISSVIYLDGFTQDKFTAVIKDVLYNPVYKRNSEKLQSLFVDRPMKPLDEAIFWVEYIGRHGKGALRSPLADMPWWQSTLLDVYAFIVLVLCLLVYILKFLIMKIIGVCRGSKTNISADVTAKKKR